MGPQRWLLLCAAAVGGLAGAVMWVAQGVYFTRNALAYDAAPAEATSLVSTRALRSDCGADGPLQASSGSSSSKCGGDGGGACPRSVKVDDNSMANGGGRGGRNTGGGGGGGMAAVNSVVYSGSSITAFAGLFAFAFQLVTTIAKPTAALLLTLYPNRRTILFSVFTGVAALCTLAMMLVAPLNRLVLSKDSEEEEVEAAEEDGGGSSNGPSHAGASAYATHDREGSSTSAAGPNPPPGAHARFATEACGGVFSCGRETLLHLLLCDRRTLLITPYNVSFGLSTAFFPSHITVLTHHVFGCAGEALTSPERAAADAAGYVGGVTDATDEDLGPAAVGWLYTLAGLSSALAAALAALAAQRYRRARSVAMLLGSAAFATAMLLGAAGGGDDGRSIPRGAIGVMYVCYGLGVAAWQGSCMALVGDLFRGDPRAAFAHLKLTSGFTTFVGFFWLPTLSLRAAALVTLAANCLGAASFAALLATDVTRPKQWVPRPGSWRRA